MEDSILICDLAPQCVHACPCKFGPLSPLLSDAHTVTGPGDPEGHRQDQAGGCHVRSAGNEEFDVVLDALYSSHKNLESLHSGGSSPATAAP